MDGNYPTSVDMFKLMEQKNVSITMYKSDSGGWVAGQDRLKKETQWEEVFEKAIQLGAPLIVRTSYKDEKNPGAWYIKWHKHQATFEEVRTMVEENFKNGKHSKRRCYLINYKIETVV